MTGENGKPAGPASAKSLPPVEAPNVRMILQLFIVPGLLVALVIGFILVFFGGVGVGPRSPSDFISGLGSQSGHKRQQTAHDLAQYLPRQAELREDVGFALDVADLLDKEMKLQKVNPPKPDRNGEVMDLLEYLPAVVGNFQVPVGLPLLEELVRTNADKLQVQLNLLRFRNALIAIGMLGARLKEFDANPPEVRERQLAALAREAGDEPGRKLWAKQALNYLQRRQAHRQAGSKEPLADDLGLVPTLTIGARGGDEMGRKLAVLALANWDEKGTEELLREMTNPGGVIEVFEDNDQARALREIRYNAALALARRGSPLTPVPIVLETLDAAKLQELYPDAKTSPAFSLMVKALRDLKAGRVANPALWDQHPEVQEAVRKLANYPAVVIQTEATRLLGQKPPDPPQPPSFGSQILLMVGLAGSIFLFLGMAAAARIWRRPAAQPSPVTSSSP